MKYHDDYDDIEEEFNLMKLLNLVKKICHNYKTQNDPLQAILKATFAYYSTKQKDSELVRDYALALENRLVVYRAVGGTVMNPGANTYIAEDLYKKAYAALTTDKKKICNTTTEEKVTAMVLSSNVDKK